jgi:hypothetical protein
MPLTTTRDRPERLVIHPSVPIRWWLTHLPLADEARQFRDDLLARGAVTLIAVQYIDFQVLDALAEDLSSVPLAGMIGQLLYDDVIATFELMAARGALRLVDPRLVARSAFFLASYFAVPFNDALTVALTEDAVEDDRTLLVADEPAFHRLRALQADRPPWRLAWLPEYLQS